MQFSFAFETITIYFNLQSQNINKEFEETMILCQSVDFDDSCEKVRNNALFKEKKKTFQTI